MVRDVTMTRETEPGRAIEEERERTTQSGGSRDDEAVDG